VAEPDSGLFEESAGELFDGAPCGYLSTQPDGTIVRANRTFLSMSGYTREQLVGRMTFQSLLTVPGRIYYDTHVRPLLHMQGFVRELAFDLSRADEHTLPVVLNAVLKKNAEGEPLLVRLTVFDATDRRQYERELLKARRSAELAAQTERDAREEAERANRAKDDFLALISHELRTPLSAILGWTQVLGRKAAGNAELRHGLEVIERNTRLQSRLVDDLLDMSRIVSGKLRLDVQQVNLANVIEAALEVASPGIHARRLRLHKILDPGVVVAGDPGRLQQIFWNLLSNATKFTPPDGSIKVVMSRVNSHIEVAFTDSGKGMTPEFLESAFERFRQSGDAATRGTEGLGLGLSIVKNLVDMHGGSVKAFSEGPGKGSTFTVNLPVMAAVVVDAGRVHPQAALTSTVRPVAPISLAGVKVVLVDDERDAREVLWRILTDHGAEVVTCGSASEAVEAAERANPDVLVSDIGMPGIDGYELIRRVRMLGGHLARVPAVALTAFSRLEDRTQALLAGYQIHLTKPVDATELLITVASLVGRISRK
jgi:PAS domain S-box-containing protein